MKTFGEKKQEIINTIEILSGEDRDMAIQYAQHQIELLKPDYPTCKTCKYLLDDGIHDYECNAVKNNVCISDMSGNYITDIDDMGCIHHSDFSEE